VIFQRLYEAPGLPRLPLPAAIEETYGELALADEVVYANFVATLDGVVAFEPGASRSAGRLISGGHPADRYLMGLLRAVADAIVVGAGTARAEQEHEWTPERAAPSAAADFAAVRKGLGLPEKAPVYIVSGGGDLDPASRAAQTSTVLGGGRHIDPRDLIGSLRSRGHRRILTEGGPRLMGGFLEAGVVDELFLTVAPVVAGREGAGRPGLAEGTRLLPDRDERWKLQSVRRAENFLFLRYALH
jgi:riboflavin biosynthesis pyrimidine reductase